MISFLLSKFPYNLRFKLTYSYNLIRAIPKLIKHRFKGFYGLGLKNSIVSLEASSICQLKCPSCPTNIGHLPKTQTEGVVEMGFLKFKDFKSFIYKNHGIKNIELSFRGEIFLNPDLKQIIKYAYHKKINLTAYTGVNFNDVEKNVLEFLVKYQFKYINISLDGTNKYTYGIYRRGGDFNKVIENIKTINAFKKKYNSKFPKLFWQFIIMGHNESELLVARKMARKLGMTFITKLNWNPSYSPTKNAKFVRKHSGLGVSSLNEFYQKYKKPYINYCKQFWTSPQITWNGKLIGCVYNKFDDFGNVFETSLKKCINSDKYKNTKLVLLGIKETTENPICKNCIMYKYLQNKPIKKLDIITNVNIR